MLRLRRAIVIDAWPEVPAGGDRAAEAPEWSAWREQAVRIELVARPGEALKGAGPSGPRWAIADVALVGRAEIGDELIVNVEALELHLGSGGFDIVHANLTHGLGGGERERGGAAAHVMKLNYTSLQHAVEPVEGDDLELPLGRPVAVLALHGQLAPVVWAFAAGAPGRRARLCPDGRRRSSGCAFAHRPTASRAGLLAGHLTAGASFGGEGEAITTAGAIDHGIRALGWDAVICGPGPGIVGSGSPLGHGGMVALDSAHSALALGCPTMLVARMSSGDQRARHRGDLTPHDHRARPVA